MIFRFPVVIDTWVQVGSSALCDRARSFARLRPPLKLRSPRMLSQAILLLTALTLMSSAPLWAQNKFRTRFGSRMTGTEEYEIAKTAEGFRLKSNSQLQLGGQKTEFTQEQTLAPDLSLRRYRLEVNRAAGPQLIEAWREDQTIHMKASAGGQEKTKTVPFAANTVILDNLITSHFQLLLDRMAANPSKASQWTFVVPQVLDVVTGKVALEGEDSGTLNGKTIQVQRYTIELPGLLGEFWAEIGRNELMRVAVPVQRIELVREGFTLLPKVEPKPEASAGFLERAVEFPSGSLRFPATLCLSATATQRMPIVVLVHGSGPQDRDESVGPNKPFRDLAHGLAAAGISTLRYDKRTLAFATQLDSKTMTIDQETIADAVAAIEFARRLPDVDPKRVFVLGHSQGATFAPTIAQRAQARGAILMAPMERPIDRTIEEQIAFQLKQAGKSDQEIALKVGELKKQFDRVRSGEAGDNEPVFHATAHYWRDFLSRDTVAELKNLQAPVLLLQGGKDVQVLKADYDLAQQALAGKPAEMREAHWLPNLNHLFMPVEGDTTGAEYGRAANIPREVIEIIAAWVNKQAVTK